MQNVITFLEGMGILGARLSILQMDQLVQFTATGQDGPSTIRIPIGEIACIVSGRLFVSIGTKTPSFPVRRCIVGPKDGDRYEITNRRTMFLHFIDANAAAVFVERLAAAMAEHHATK